MDNLEDSLEQVNIWMKQNRLKMNNSKTELIFFGGSKQLQKCSTDTMMVDGCEVSRTLSIKYLGAVLDQTLSN